MRLFEVDMFRVLINELKCPCYGRARRQVTSKPPQLETRTPHALNGPQITVTAIIVRRVQATVALLLSPHDKI